MICGARGPRCLLLLSLVSLIVLSVLPIISRPLTITTTSPSSSSSSSSLELRSNSSTTSTIKITPLKVNPPQKQTCNPYNVRDARPFFEREPPQSNLPRPISNTTRDDVLRRLRSLRLALVACAKNVEKKVENFRKYAESIVDLFHPTSRILILESDSRDNTLAKLRQWQRAQVYTYGNLAKTIRERPERIAYCRNVLLEKARQLQPDYMLVVDFDIFGANVSSFLSNFDYDTNDWSVMTANLIRYYYDIWALRTLSDTVLNYDVWHRVGEIRSKRMYCSLSVRTNIVDIHQKPYSPHRPLLEVRSAFGGAGLYKMEVVKGCSYCGDNLTCEHVPFHLCIREKNNARIFINAKFTNEKYGQ